MFSIITMLTKPQALKVLRCSPRTLARYVTQGKLVASYQITKQGREARFDEEQVRKLKSSIAAERAVVHTPAPGNGAAGSVALEKRSQQAGIGILETLQTQLREPGVTLSELRHKLTYTLDEASRVSGLGPTYLRKAIKDGRLAAIPTGRGSRIRRDVLIQFVGKQ
jgi:excisionase family DNA binding protein